MSMSPTRTGARNAKIRHVVPEITLARVMPLGLAQTVFDLCRGAGYAVHAMPMNRTPSQIRAGTASARLPLGDCRIGCDALRRHSRGHPDRSAAVDAPASSDRSPGRLRCLCPAGGRRSSQPR